MREIMEEMEKGVEKYINDERKSHANQRRIIYGMVINS